MNYLVVWLSIVAVVILLVVGCFPRSVGHQLLRNMLVDVLLQDVLDYLHFVHQAFLVLLQAGCLVLPGTLDAVVLADRRDSGLGYVLCRHELVLWMTDRLVSLKDHNFILTSIGGFLKLMSDLCLSLTGIEVLSFMLTCCCFFFSSSFLFCFSIMCLRTSFAF